MNGTSVPKRCSCHGLRIDMPLTGEQVKHRAVKLRSGYRVALSERSCSTPARTPGGGRGAQPPRLACRTSCPGVRASVVSSPRGGQRRRSRFGSRPGHHWQGLRSPFHLARLASALAVTHPMPGDGRQHGLDQAPPEFPLAGLQRSRKASSVCLAPAKLICRGDRPFWLAAWAITCRTRL